MIKADVNVMSSIPWQAFLQGLSVRGHVTPIVTGRSPCRMFFYFEF